MSLSRPTISGIIITGKVMARKAVVEIKCDRCDRIEYKDETEVVKAEFNDLTLTFQGEQSVVYKDLCTPCRKTVGRYVSQILKDIAGKSPDRAKKEESEDSPNEVDVEIMDEVKPLASASVRSRRPSSDRPNLEE